MPKIHFDGKIAKFFRTLIFEFCNTITPKAHIWLQRNNGRYGPWLCEKSDGCYDFL